mgnify:CR=1 FL=1
MLSKLINKYLDIPDSHIQTAHPHFVTSRDSPRGLHIWCLPILLSTPKELKHEIVMIQQDIKKAYSHVN